MSDLLRVFVLAEAGGLLAFAAVVMAEARKFRAPPRHIWFIGASYATLIVGYSLEVWNRFGDSLGWRSFLALFAFSFGIYAMAVMYRAYQYEIRKRRHQQRSDALAQRMLDRHGAR